MDVDETEIRGRSYAAAAAAAACRTFSWELIK